VRHGGTSGSSVCPCGLVYRMDELHVLLMLPRVSGTALGVPSNNGGTLT
jgi:hypothetical protein